jgi:hypothetical protein
MVELPKEEPAMRSSVLSGMLFAVLIASAAAAQPKVSGASSEVKGLKPAGGQACNVPHAANTHPCTSLSGNPKEGTWYIVLREGAFKTCGPGGEPGETCVEKDKATHVIEIYRNAKCAGTPRKINVSEKRCD